MLRILSVAYPCAAVGPDAVGGAEQILTHLDAAIVRAGHESIVVACEGSVTRGRLIATEPPRGELTDRELGRRQDAHRRTIVRAVKEHQPDLIHMHGIDFHTYLPPAGVPVLATLHLPLSWYPDEIFGLTRPKTFLHCVSDSQLRADGDRVAPMTAVNGAAVRLLPGIENGVPVEGLPKSHARRPFVMSLGRICPEKGFHLAMDAAAGAGVLFLLAGSVYPYPPHEEYFRTEIVPRLDHRRRFIGPVAVERKQRLLSAARAILIPSLAWETSSLVAMEALACGTPVIAFPKGALPDIIEHGKTGFLVDSVPEMAEAIQDAATLDPADCLRAARDRFNVDRMTAQYLDLYREITAPTEVRTRRAGKPVHVSRRLHVDLIESPDRFADLAPAWRRLWTMVPHATPFQLPEWLIPWWRHFGGGELLAFSFRDGARLVGLAPLYLDPSDRTVRFLGTGNSDCLDVLIQPGYGKSVVSALFNALSVLGHRWDLVDLHELPPESALLASTAVYPHVERVGRQSVSPYLSARASTGRLEDAIPRPFFKRIQYCRRRARREGSAETVDAHAENLDQLFDALIDLHATRWQVEGEPGVLEDHASRAFHREVINGMQASGNLMMHAMRFNGRPVACFYGFVFKRRACYYLGGFDPELGALSPGHQVVLHAIERAASLGVRRFHFLRGAEEYKYRWGCTDDFTMRKMIWVERADRSPSAGGRVALPATIQMGEPDGV